MERRVKMLEFKWEECRKRLVEAAEATTSLNDQNALDKQSIHKLTELSARLQEELTVERSRAAQYQEEIDNYQEEIVNYHHILRESSVGHDTNVQMSPVSRTAPYSQMSLAFEMVGFIPCRSKYTLILDTQGLNSTFRTTDLREGISPPAEIRRPVNAARMDDSHVVMSSRSILPTAGGPMQTGCMQPAVFDQLVDVACETKPEQTAQITVKDDRAPVVVNVQTPGQDVIAHTL